MAIIGPKITALGEMVFIKAVISPALHIKPFSFQIKLTEIKMIIPMAVRILPLNGILRL